MGAIVGKDREEVSAADRVPWGRCDGGYVDEFRVGEHLRDARVTTLCERTSQIQKLLIGRALTGINAF